MKNPFNFKNNLLFLFFIFSGILFSQDFTNKTNNEIAKIFNNTSNFGNDHAAAKNFHSKLLQYFKTESPNDNETIGLKMANVIKELYALKPTSAYRFIMATERDDPHFILPHLSLEQTKFIIAEARGSTAKVTLKKEVAPVKETVQSGDNLYGGAGSFPQKFEDSKYTIFFPRAKINAAHEIIYPPKMKYMGEVIYKFPVATYDFKYMYYSDDTTYATVRFKPNNPQYSKLKYLDEKTSMLLMIFAINRIHTSPTYLKAKQTGGYYSINSDFKPIGWTSSYIVSQDLGTTVAKAYRNEGDSDFIVQIIKTPRTLKYESDLTKDERFFLDNAVEYNQK